MLNDALILPLGEVVDISAGYSLRGSARSLDEGDVHFLQLQHVRTEANIDWGTVPKVDLPSGRKPNWLSDNDIVFSARGTRTLAYPLKDTPKHTVCAPQFFVLTPRSSAEVLPEFLAWQINQRPAQDYLAKFSNTAAIATVTRRTMTNLTIAVPPRDVQKTIVKLWEAARDERALLNEIIENREKQLEVIAAELFQKSEGAAA